jgi:hypothetical protein
MFKVIPFCIFQLFYLILILFLFDSILYFFCLIFLDIEIHRNSFELNFFRLLFLFQSFRHLTQVRNLAGSIFFR